MSFYKNGISKIVNLLNIIFDDKDLTRFVTKKELKFSIKQEESITTQEWKYQGWDEIFVNLVMRILLWKGLLLLSKMLIEIMMEITNHLFLKIMLRLLTAFEG